MPPGVGYNDPLTQFVQKGPSQLDWMDKFVPAQRANITNKAGQSNKSWLRDLSSTYAAAAAPPTASTLPIGYSTLAQILGLQGKTDPGQMNMDIADILRRTQGQKDALTGNLASQGLQRSGVGAALGEAVSQGGNELVARRQAEETTTAEARKRSDLELLTRMIIDPSLSAAGIAEGTPAANKGPSSTDQLLQLAAIFGASYFGCWVAAEVFDGWDDPRTHAARRYIHTAAPKALRDAYMRHGQALAEKVRRNPALRDLLRPRFEAFALAGRA